MLDFLKDIAEGDRIAFHVDEARFRYHGNDFYPFTTIHRNVPNEVIRRLNLLRFSITCWRQVLRSHNLDLRVLRINTRDKEPVFQASRNFLLGNKYDESCIDWLKGNTIKNIVFEVVQLNR